MKNYYFLLLLLLFAACEEEPESFKLDLPELTFSDISIRCYPTSPSAIIDSDSAYQAFQDENNGNNCADSSYPQIDFTMNTLLGVSRSAACRIGDRYWNVYIDETANKYVFQAISEGEGNCYMLALDRFWITVPKLPDDYTVEFVEYEY